jgi:hypothetical protein
MLQRAISITVINALIFKKRADKSALFVIFAPNKLKN